MGEMEGHGRDVRGMEEMGGAWERWEGHGRGEGNGRREGQCVSVTK